MDLSLPIPVDVEGDSFELLSLPPSKLIFIGTWLEQEFTVLNIEGTL